MRPVYSQQRRATIQNRCGGGLTDLLIHAGNSLLITPQTPPTLTEHSSERRRIVPPLSHDDLPETFAAFRARSHRNEQTRGALINALLMFSDVHIFPVNPAALANYRKAFAHGGGKNDPADAQLLCQYLSHYSLGSAPETTRKNESTRSWRRDHSPQTQ